MRRYIHSSKYAYTHTYIPGLCSFHTRGLSCTGPAPSIPILIQATIAKKVGDGHETLMKIVLQCIAVYMYEGRQIKAMVRMGRAG